MGDSEVQDPENHFMAGVVASSHAALAMALKRIQGLAEKIDGVGDMAPAALPLRAETVQVLFVHLLLEKA